jgi:Ca2+-binding RTX toxin-like protein
MVDGESVFFNRDDIRAIFVDGGAGNDAVRLRSSGNPLLVPTTLVGGDGDDHLVAIANMSDRYGDFWYPAHDEVGPVTMLGGDGNDTLYGSAGPTLLDGGPGIDQHEPRGDDTTIVDPGEIPVVPPPPESPTPAPEPVDAPAPAPVPTEEDPEPTDVPAPSGAAVLAATPTTAAATAGDPAPAVYDDASPLLGGADDDVFAN